jgi:general secretion pathway protein I
MRRRDLTHDEGGFTLIEVLVALSIFSLAVLALMNVAGENTRAAAAVATRMLAQVVAENRGVEALVTPGPLPVGQTEGAEAAGGRLWRWTRKVSQTADPAILRVDVSVVPDGAVQQVANLTLFKGTQ